jgi:hypothetical protein
MKKSPPANFDKTHFIFEVEVLKGAVNLVGTITKTKLGQNVRIIR